MPVENSPREPPRPQQTVASSSSQPGAKRPPNLPPLQVSVEADSPTRAGPLALSSGSTALVAQPQYNSTLAMRRPMPPHLSNLLQATAGPDYRAPLFYTGDPFDSLGRLREDVVTHYRGLCRVLGDYERHDLTQPPPPGLGIGYAGLLQGGYSSMPPLPSSGQQSLAGIGDVVSSSIHSGGGALSSYWGQRSALPGSVGYGGYGGTYGLGGGAPALSVGPGGGGLALFGGHAGVANSMLPIPGLRASTVSSVRQQQPIDGNMFTREESSLVYPPVGRTFEGRRSTSAAPVMGRPIDSMDDFRFNRPRPMNFDVEGLQPMNGPVSRLHGSRDTLDTFLKDYSKGASKPAVAYAGGIAGTGGAGGSTYLSASYNKSQGYGQEYGGTGGMGTAGFGSTFYGGTTYGGGRTLAGGMPTRTPDLAAALAHYAAQPVGQS